MMSERYQLPEAFETTRYKVRRVRPSDADGIFHAYGSDPAVTHFLSWRPSTTPDQSRANIEATSADWDAGRRFASVIFPRTDAQEVMGMIDARVSSGYISYGYVLKRGAWGQGCMTEVLSWEVQHALSHPTIHRVEALCDVENVASARVMEKVGMTREGILKRRLLLPNISDKPRDCFIYAKVR